MRTEFGLPESASEGDPLAALSIGNFDGVHRGHRMLVDRMVAAAREHGGESVLVTFDPHPRCVLDPDHCPPRLTTLDEKAALLEAAGLDRMVVLEFTRELSRWTADQFLERLTQGFNLRRMVIGHDFALGHRRAGDIPFLRSWGDTRGFDVEVVGAQREGEEVFSSSLVRTALAEGDLESANRVLGHAYFVDSRVEHGENIGTGLGFPTANLAITPGKCLPPRGIYATWVRVGGEWHQAATYVGYRPTFGGTKLTVEPHLLDFSRDIYHQQVRVAFIARLRDDMRFTTPEALSAQMRLDVEETRRRLGREGEPAQLG
ncbi:MAG TPA: bifunctional riboflavin kinase/FAD synthetase [Candidatus Dormibacteraeota bacterium]|nr:bifunctional riboflavin kinase/FAD synthetase [Candidatus Dormibacteraeota bacterium]